MRIDNKPVNDYYFLHVIYPFKAYWKEAPGGLPRGRF